MLSKDDKHTLNIALEMALDHARYFYHPEYDNLESYLQDAITIIHKTPKTDDKALDLLQVYTLESYKARKQEILRLCREWGVTPVEITTKTHNGYTKLKYDYNRTIAKLARHILLHRR